MASMVSDIRAKLLSALAGGKHPAKVVMSKHSLAALADSLRRNDPQRKSERIFAANGLPAIYNDFTRGTENLIPKRFVITDPTNNVKVEVKIEVSSSVPDGVFVTQYTDEPIERMPVEKTDEEKIRDMWEGKPSGNPERPREKSSIIVPEKPKWNAE